LEQTFRTLADHPELGQHRDDLHPGVRMFVPAKPAHHYVVFYYAAGLAIEISDVIHSARDWVGLFARGER
jgi:plasmid stabilization system protein ParE